MRFVSPLLLAALLAAAPEAAAQDASRVAVQAETAALTSADAAQGDILGYDVALSGDRALLGATAADPAGESSGAAYVFHRTEAGWAEEAKLVPDDAAAGDYFGVAVALDADRALVGGTHHDGQRGAAYVFQRTASGWAQEAKLPVPGAAGDHAGVSVALRGDRAVVGADKAGGTGAAYVFQRTASGWALDATLAAPGAEAGDGFGWSVDLSDTHVAVGAYGRDGGRGAAYVFDAATGALARTFTAPDADAGDNLGIGVALDGDRLVAGAPFDDQAGDDAGAAYVFPLDGGAPTKLTSPEGAAGDYFGWSVATRGGRALVGARLDDSGVRNGGAAVLFTHAASGWTPEAKLVGETTASASAGVSVALGDAEALVGAPYHNVSRGIAHVFTLARSTNAEAVPEAALTLGVAPNPLADRARVTFALPEAGHVRAAVYDLLGREVAVLADAPFGPGAQSLDLDGARLGAGVYVLRLVAGGRAEAVRFTVAR
ncbi:MAG: T9SS type A sorting domain-containing protein [Bacteroidota bacterium]